MSTSALDMVEDGEGDEIEHATLKSSNKSALVGDPETMEEEVRGNPSLDVFWLCFTTAATLIELLQGGPRIMVDF